MAKGIKRANSELIAELDAKIAKAKENLKTLEDKKKALLDEETKVKLQSVINLMNKKNMSIDDVIEKLSK